MAIETFIAEKFINDTLKNDGTLTSLINKRVYSSEAPEGATFPFIVFNLQSDFDSGTFNNKRIYVRLTYLVYVVAKTASFADIKSIAERLDELLDDVQNVVLPNGLVEDSKRVSIYRFADTDDSGIKYRYLGGSYDITVQATA